MKVNREPNAIPEPSYAPRKMSFAENAIMTIKLLAGFAILGAALWGISVWTAVKN